LFGIFDEGNANSVFYAPAGVSHFQLANHPACETLRQAREFNHRGVAYRPT
jgi:hypothetical protein